MMEMDWNLFFGWVETVGLVLQGVRLKVMFHRTVYSGVFGRLCFRVTVIEVMSHTVEN